MTIDDFLKLTLGIVYNIGLIGILIVFPFLFIKQKYSLLKLEGYIKEKIKKDISLTSADIISFGKASGLNFKLSREPVYSLFQKCNDKNEHEIISKLISDIEKSEPFDNMPDEIKPSLITISKLIEKKGSEGDENLLLPIHKCLSKYVELEAERDKFKRRARWGAVISIVSLLLGGLSSYQTMQAPTIDQINDAIRSAIQSEQGSS